jgi:hypothetical protein
MNRQYAPPPPPARQAQPGLQPEDRVQPPWQDEDQPAVPDLDAIEAELAGRKRQLEQEIEQLLSSDPEQFVIRFLQTEGQ